MEYRSSKHGLDIIAGVWEEAVGKEDPILVYQRLIRINREQFNDEICEAVTRFVTRDIPRMERVCSNYANQYRCKLDKANEGWYQTAQSCCPQSHRYNVICLNVPESGEVASLDSKRIAGDEAFRSVQVDEAGWRYGFVAMGESGERVYNKTNKGRNGANEAVRFETPQNTQSLWLVMTGASTEHWKVLRGWGELVKEKGKEAQWPHQVRLNGTSFHSSILKAERQ